MNHQADEVLRTVHKWPWRSASDVPNPELSYWLSRAEETIRREPTVSKDLLRAARIEIQAVLLYGSTAVRIIFGTTAFFAWISALLLLITRGQIPLTLLPGNSGARMLALIICAFALGGVFRSLKIWVAGRCAHRVVIGRERLHRWLSMPATPPTGAAGGAAWNPSPAAPSNAGSSQYAGPVATVAPAGTPRPPLR